MDEQTNETDYKNIKDEFSKLEEKYFKLVWFARSRPEDIKIKGVREAVEDVIKLYPSEVAALQSNTSDWQHGFHSGMLAATRFFLTAREYGLDEAREAFPELDS